MENKYYGGFDYYFSLLLLTIFGGRFKINRIKLFYHNQKKMLKLNCVAQNYAWGKIGKESLVGAI